MPRDAAGVYTLPNASVVGGTTITTAWANSTMDDLEQAMTDSLSRTGDGGMQAPLQFDDGTEAAPGISWVNEISTGFRRFGAGDMRAGVLGEDKVRFINDAVNPVGSEKPLLVWDGSAWREVNYGTPTLEVAFMARVNASGTILSSFNIAGIAGGGGSSPQLTFTDFITPNDIVVVASPLSTNSKESNITITSLGSTALQYRTYEVTGGASTLAVKDVSIIGYISP